MSMLVMWKDEIGNPNLKHILLNHFLLSDLKTTNTQRTSSLVSPDKTSAHAHTQTHFIIFTQVLQKDVKIFFSFSKNSKVEATSKAISKDRSERIFNLDIFDVHLI